MARTFAGAIIVLRRFQNRKPTEMSVSYAKDSEPIPGLQFQGRPHLEGMAEWLRLLGHDDTIHRLQFIHIAGTKGKGSTCAYVDSLLRAHSKRTGIPRKVGLYTSPHLVDEIERIRISGSLISQDLFAKYAWEVIDILSMNSDKEVIGHKRPGFLQSMFLISIHTFLAEKVDIAIVEAYTGGRFCATNSIKHPAITAVTMLLLDHIPELGNSIESITWHKAGILKTGAFAFSASQVPAATYILKEEARKKHVHLEFVGTCDIKSLGDSLPFSRDVQRQNFSLAKRVCAGFLKSQQQLLSDDDVSTAAGQVNWPGRFQTFHCRGVTWYLDVAHSQACIEEPVKWFKDTSYAQEHITRIVVFAHIPNPRRRDGAQLLTRLAETMKDEKLVPDHFFITRDKVEDVPELLRRYKEICEGLLPTHTHVEVEPSLQQVLDRIETIQQQSEGVHVLITGSVFLVGEALKLLGYSIK